MKALASLAAVLALAAAGSVSAQEARIAWGDLDLSSTAGADAFGGQRLPFSRRPCDCSRDGRRLSMP